MKRRSAVLLLLLTFGLIGPLRSATTIASSETIVGRESKALSGLALSQDAACPPVDPNPQPPPSGGPYYHQVYRAFSADGISFTAEEVLLLDHASVPDAVLRPDGETWVYFVNGEPGQHGIWIARRTDDGKWQTLSCVRLNGEFNPRAVDPDIVRLPDGRYRLFYYANFGPPPPGREHEPSVFVSAISEDGINFTIEREVLRVECGADPSVIQLPDRQWLMAFIQQGRIALATSPDGYDFHPIGVGFPGPGIPELAALPDGQVRLYIGSERLSSYISANGGQTWTPELVRFQSEKVKGAGHPSLVRMPDGTWTLFYVVVRQQPPSQGDQGPFFHQIYSASSSDGLRWTFDNILLLDHASVPAAVVTPEGKIRIYYVDATERPENTNCAESSDRGLTFKVLGCTIANRAGEKALDPSIVRLPDGRYRLYYLAATGDPRRDGPALHL